MSDMDMDDELDADDSMILEALKTLREPTTPKRVHELIQLVNSQDPAVTTAQADLFDVGYVWDRLDDLERRGYVGCDVVRAGGGNYLHLYRLLGVLERLAHAAQ